jgi:perosamine synthetase
MMRKSSFKVRKDQRLSAQYWTMSASVVDANQSKRIFPFWARNAIFHGLRFLDVSPGDRVLAPSYICRAAIEPIVASGATVDFYRVRGNCLVDVEDVASRITSATKALLAVHYFGFPQDIEPLQALCRKNGLALIEDCAHVLEGHTAGRPLGSFGDVSVFSWRKFLPVYDGADLVLNRASRDANVAWEDEHWLFTVKVAKNLLEDALGYSVGRSLRRLLNWGRTLPSSGAEAQVLPLTVTCGSDAFDPRLINWSMSRLSRWVKSHSDIPAIVDARRLHYQYLGERLKDIDGIELLHPTLPDGVCPWVLPVTFDGMTDAHVSLRREGIPAVTWGGVRPVAPQPGVFCEADWLYERLVFLPVHQSLSTFDLDLIIESVGKVCSRRSTLCDVPHVCAS